MKLSSWSKDRPACVRCKETSRPHFGKGLCRRCYLSDYNKRNLKQVRKLRDNWYRKNITPAFQKLKREELHYGGLREAALKRDKYKCVRCGAIKLLCVHHKDRNGRPVEITNKNNTLANLETLCRKCHINEHRIDLFQGFLKSKKR